MSGVAVAVGPDAPILEVMASMRAMRRLKPDPVPEELLVQLVEAATWAPSGSNQQGAEFVVVTDREVMRQLADPWRRVFDIYMASVSDDGMTKEMPLETYRRTQKALRYQRDHFHETPALFVACYTAPSVMAPAPLLRALGPRDAARLVARSPKVSQLEAGASIYPAVQNLLLAARALGLGATLTEWHLLLEHEFKAILGIPRGVQTYALIPVGYPMGRFGPVRRRPAREVMRRDRW